MPNKINQYLQEQEYKREIPAVLALSDSIHKEIEPQLTAVRETHDAIDSTTQRRGAINQGFVFELQKYSTRAFRYHNPCAPSADCEMEQTSPVFHNATALATRTEKSNE